AHGDRDGDVCDVADLRGEIRGHRIDALGQVFPDAGHLAHLRLTAELAFGADLARHARHLRGEHAELLDHGVDDICRAQELALQRVQQLVKVRGCAAVDRTIGRFRSYRAWRRTIGLEFADRLFVRLHGFLPARMNRHDVTSAAPPSRRQADAAVSLGRVNRKAADGKWRGERYAEPSTVRAGGARRSRPPPEPFWRARCLDLLRTTLRPVDPAMCLYPSVIQVRPPPDAANAETIHSFQPSGKFFFCSRSMFRIRRLAARYGGP